MLNETLVLTRVHKADHREVEHQADGGKLPAQLQIDGVVEVDFGKADVERANDVEQDHPQWNRRADPKPLGAHNRPPIVVDQQPRHLHQRKNQPLVLDPLAAKDHHQAKAGKVHGQDQAQQPKQRPDPDVKRQGLPLGQSLVEPTHGVAVGAGHDPIGQIGMDIARPVVFRGGSVVRR